MRSSWARVMGRAQTQILVWVTVLVLGAVVGATLTTRQLLRIQLEERIGRALEQEVSEIKRLVDGRNPLTGDPFGGDVKAIFDVFLSRNIPAQDEAFIALVNGSRYATTPEVLPLSAEQQAHLFAQWQGLTQRQKGQITLDQDTWIYLAYPLPTQGADRGLFVVVQSLTNQQRELNRLVWLEAQVFGLSALVALVLSWLATGRVLSPLRGLTQTARSITATDDRLQQRIPVRGTTEIAELTETFNAMLARLQVSFASQRNFLNDASHELQTPITIVQGHLELLDQNPAEQAEAIALMQDELQRMSRLVKDLLVLATAERQDFLALTIVPVDEFLQALYSKVAVMAPRQWGMAQRPAVRIVADRDRLTQAMMNLIQNAIDHTTPADTIEIGAKLVDANLHFWVRDTGLGIPPADQNRIFQRFARGTESRKRSSGSGLGLAIVQAIAEAHGGQVQLSATSPQGSCFTLILPLEPPQDRGDW